MLICKGGSKSSRFSATKRKGHRWTRYGTCYTHSNLQLASVGFHLQPLA